MFLSARGALEQERGIAQLSLSGNTCGPGWERLSFVTDPQAQAAGTQAWTCTEKELGEAAPILLYPPLWPQSWRT